MTTSIETRLMHPHDLVCLHKICCEAYSQNFYQHWEPAGLENYLENVFGINVLKNELDCTEIRYHVAIIKHEPVAFMKLNLSSNLPNHNPEAGIELEKIYILPQFKRKKIGKKLLDLAFEIAGINNKEILWLAVIDTNIEAIAFYERAGFTFHNKTHVNCPKFKQELKGMWRMYFDLSKEKVLA
ncbi:MAG TPA: GNAT family N-acetyltransferase [Chitinophagaceae bacterium]|nr:GNAT family N-acetyltransferase [Chitinophagaceae bacterium]